MLSVTTSTQPLADKIRPDDVSNIVGQEHLFDKNGIITRILKS
jgi:replication-associated recombination protein RarA